MTALTVTPRADRTRKARHSSRCPLCGGPVLVGQRIGRIRHRGRLVWPHTACIVAIQRATFRGRLVDDVPAGRLL
jgi:hypothetical protein